jgi:hypothetical protein
VKEKAEAEKADDKARAAKDLKEVQLAYMTVYLTVCVDKSNANT